MKALSRIGLLAGLTALLCLTAVAQERRTIPVTVLDKDGRIVEGLTAANFRAKFRGKPAEVLSAEFNRRPRHIAVFLDASASMKMEERWVRSLEILRTLTERFSSEDLLEFVVFAEEHETVVPPTTDGGVVSVALEALPTPDSKPARASWGRKTKTEAVLRDWLRERGDSRLDVVVFITDGAAVHSPSLRGARDLLLQRSARMILLNVDKVVGLVLWSQRARQRDWAQDPPREYDLQFSADAHLSRAAYQTGGGTVLTTLPPNHTRAAPTEKIAAEIIEKIGRVYSLVVSTRRPVDKRRKWKLEVVDENGKKMKGVKVHYPRYLVPLEDPAKD